MPIDTIKSDFSLVLDYRHWVRVTLQPDSIIGDQRYYFLTLRLYRIKLASNKVQAQEIE